MQAVKTVRTARTDGGGGAVAEAVAAAYDPFLEPLLGDPYAFFAQARAEAPVFYAAAADRSVVSDVSFRGPLAPEVEWDA
ncbi:hypothetical protein Gocc_1341 [Gaiella occulta]|uniref:Uncharacterized protein n=1 Tax=Gaiella occulta TaxID=1002870 RepID=A0A7M2Z193_9ACTN|nr:hypothetical protein [Gaiella occulta]RDI75543.1 hypothetical protein Gocc_1341 [Gaiella occulta]